MFSGIFKACIKVQNSENKSPSQAKNGLNEFLAPTFFNTKIFKKSKKV